ncbi:iron(III) transport system substrate-binding protein [Povalibacter uvarum]|uniref:Iron(III) transport system substrate-binding protein n=1 Tax=Povalibacter uvarum TaxID=732238 RepID=A0A841HRZ5_9GAMM|nr:extracellular solute-binding protein [Povalibacter uvarum]MBB6095666.1 iron(III) transport system substrate-binding protein [Povalibacter uvarum]
MKRLRFAGLHWLLLGSLALLVSCAPPPSELIVYSARNETLIQPIIDKYTAETGQKVQLITDDAGPLIQRLNAEGKNSPADLLITVDAGVLWHAAQLGVLRSIESPVLDANIPEHLRDPRKRWFGLTVRARTIVYSTERVKPEELDTYESLTNEKWRGRLCLRTSKSVYNQSLVAMLIAQHGEEKTEQIVRGWVANLATPAFANDTLLMQAIAAGQCDVGIVNTYYFGRLQRDQPDLPLKLFWPDQNGQGTHVNISGAGVTAHAPRAEQAQKFLEWLSQPQAQALFASLDLEYPASPSAKAVDQVAGWGEFKQSPLNVAQAGELQPAAVRLMDRAGYL